MNPVEQYLQSNQITYTLHEHPAVFTCEEAEQHCAHIPGLACKNLFLRGKELGKFYLAILPAKKRADLKAIGAVVGDKKMTFASAEDLKRKLGLTPGEVSPFGLINNPERDVIVCLDADVAAADTVTFHPNRNTATLEITCDMFRKFLETIGHEVCTIS